MCQRTVATTLIAFSVIPTETHHSRLGIVEDLRGMAALAVAWFHFTRANTEFPTIEWLRASGTYGWLGVECFFVISGFIIPYAMFRAGYRFSHWPTFLAKRLLRLEPPYIVAILVTLVLWWVSSWSPAFTRASPTVPQVLLHLAYLPTLFGYQWLDTSYWTLGIEFQYYVLIALAFPCLAHRSLRVRLACLGLACALPFLVTSEWLVFRYLALFALGAVTFWRHAGLVSRNSYVVCVAAAAMVTAMSFGLAVAAVAVATTLVILRGRSVGWRLLTWLGTLSYSLYLLHGPIGDRVVNLGARYARGPVAQVMVIVAALGVSLAVAHAAHRWIEQPAIRWSSRLRY